MNAMDARERGIASRLDEARDREQLAEAREQEYRDKARAFDDDYAKRLDAARDAAEQEKVRLMQAAREETERQRAKWLGQLRQEQDDFAAALRRELGQEAIRIARKALADVAEGTLERQAIAVFLKHLATVPQSERESLTQSENTLRLTSAFDLDEDTREYAQAALRERLGTTVNVRFKRDRDLLCGVELAGSGYKLSWNVADYLAGVDERVGAKLAGSAAARVGHA
jgi:F-type H+-transporting ATPase subunit b